MCYIIGQVAEQAAIRSHLSGGAGAVPSVYGEAPSGIDIARQYERITQAKSDARSFNTRLVLLGTAGGPTYWTNTNRRSASSAIVVGDAIYVVDCGDGAGKRLQEALDPPNNLAMFSTVRALFFNSSALRPCCRLSKPAPLRMAFWPRPRCFAAQGVWSRPSRRDGTGIQPSCEQRRYTQGRESEKPHAGHSRYDRIPVSSLCDRHQRPDSR